MSVTKGRRARINGFARSSPTYRSRCTVVSGWADAKIPTESGVVEIIAGIRARVGPRAKKSVSYPERWTRTSPHRLPVTVPRRLLTNAGSRAI